MPEPIARLRPCGGSAGATAISSASGERLRVCDLVQIGEEILGGVAIQSEPSAGSLGGKRVDRMTNEAITREPEGADREAVDKAAALVGDADALLGDAFGAGEWPGADAVEPRLGNEPPGPQ